VAGGFQRKAEAACLIIKYLRREEIFLKLLIIGSGGREHALGWKIKQSPKTDKLFFAPGNAGSADLGMNLDVDATDFPALKEVILQHHVDLVVILPR